jgi:tetratricopeptide (TPR) repeat protein
MTKARSIHNQAEIAREKEQNYIKALKFLDEAFVEYIKIKDYYGASDSFGSRFIVYKHLYEKSLDKSYLLLAVTSAQTSVKLAKINNVKNALSRACLNLGKAYEEAEEFKKSAEAFKKSLIYFKKFKPPEFHSTPAIKADMEAHLAYVDYMSGNKSALEDLEKSIQDLQKYYDGSYAISVWLSGAHMRAAKMLQKDNPEQSQKHLFEAKQIIDSNPELKLREKQWEKLNKELT